MDKSNVMHIERINVHRVLSINSMYSRSYNLNQHKVNGNILGVITQVCNADGTT